MKLGAFLVATGLLCVTTQSVAEIYRCKGTVKWGGMDIQVRLDIAMPERTDSTVTLSSNKGQLNRTPVGIGKLEVLESTSQATGKLQKYDLLLTTLNTSYPIHGFVVSGNNVHVLRADLYEKGKPFSYFDSFLNRLIVGGCE